MQAILCAMCRISIILFIIIFAMVTDAVFLFSRAAAGLKSWDEEEEEGGGGQIRVETDHVAFSLKPVFFRLRQLHDFLFFNSFERLMAAVVWIHFYIGIIHTIINCRWERYAFIRNYFTQTNKQTLNTTHYGRVIAKWLLKVIFRIIDQQKMSVFVSLLFVFNLMCVCCMNRQSRFTLTTHTLSSMLLLLLPASFTHARIW